MTDAELAEGARHHAHPDGARRGRRRLQRRARGPQAHARGARRHLPRQDHALERSQARRRSPGSRSCPTSPSPSSTARTARARPPSSPTTSAKVSPEWKTEVGAGKSVKWPVGLGGKGNEGVTGSVKSTPGAIGYVELAYAKQNKLTMASIKNADGNVRRRRRSRSTSAAAAGVDDAGRLPRLDHQRQGQGRLSDLVVHLHPRLQGAGGRGQGQGDRPVPVVGDPRRPEARGAARLRAAAEAGGGQGRGGAAQRSPSAARASSRATDVAGGRHGEPSRARRAIAPSR